MKFEIIEEYITQFPIYQYALLDSSQLEFSDKVRTICKRECPRYGNSWSCPPAVGSVEKCKGNLSEISKSSFVFFCGRGAGLL